MKRTFASFSTQSMHSFHWSLWFLLLISKDGEEGGAAMHKTLRHSPFRSNFPVLRISLKLNSKAFPEDKAGRAFHQLARKRRKWTVMATAWKGRADRGTESLHSADRKLEAGNSYTHLNCVSPPWLPSQLRPRIKERLETANEPKMIRSRKPRDKHKILRIGSISCAFKMWTK